MPKPPRIADPGKREVAIALIMALALAGSLLLVAVLTRAPWIQSPTPPNSTSQGSTL